MADFLADTRVEGVSEEPDRFHAELSPRWAVWGPNGGYVAAIALRAAMARSRFSRPASFQCHFLTVGEFGPVQVHVVPVGGGKRAESLRVEILQKDRALLAATVWMVDEGLRGFEHDFGSAPDVPGFQALQGYHDLVGDEYEQWYPIWRSMEGRPIRWREPPGRPECHTWLRFTDTPIRDREADAVRQLFWLDFPGWNATISAHAWPFPYLTPNLDLTVQFHRFGPEQTWTLAEGFGNGHLEARVSAEPGLRGGVRARP
jgi:acyl-CoA thioesterase